MEDLNQKEHDPIPEGLEFQESYMQSAFAMYDAEKEKRKRRLLIWWITSAVGFASVLLIGLYLFSKGELAGKPDRKGTSTGTIQKQLPETNQTTASETGTSSAELPATIRVKNQAATATPFSGTTASRTGFSNRSTIVRNGKYPVSTTPGTSDAKTGTKPESTPKETGFQAVSSGKPGNSESGSIAPKTPEASSIAFFDPVQLPARAVTWDQVDSIRTLPETDLKSVTEIPLSRHQLYMNLGVNTLFGMKELQHRFTLRESIGLSYHYRINSQIAIGAGMEYHSISRISYKRMIGDTLNSDKTTTILNKTTLNYISFLPQVSYSPWRNHCFTAGFGIEYLLTDVGERYEIENYTKEVPKRSNSKLYYSTFNRFNFSASLGYSYQFSPFMSVQAAYYFGFTDITINNGYNSTFDRNSRLHLGLKIKLR